MVLEGLVSSLLNDYLGAFIEGLDSSQLSLRVWSGKVHLTNLTVKPTALDHLQLPVTVAFGRVDDLRLEANWRSLGSQPVRVELSGVHIRLQPRTAFDVDEAAVCARQLASKLSSLSAVHEFRLQAESEAAKSSSSTTSYMRRLTATIVDNVQLSVRDIHVTYTAADGGVTLGVGLEELSAYTTDSEWRRGFFASSDVSYRLASMSSLFVYLDDSSGASKQRATLDVLHDRSTRFLLSPVSGSMQMSINKDESASPRVSLTASFHSIAVFLTQPQYRHILQLLSELSKSTNTMQSALSAAPSSSTGRELTRDERRRYTDLYKRTLNAMWLPELTADEQAEVTRLETEASYQALAQARTHGFYELKKELAGRTVMTREAAQADASKGNGRLLKGWFGRNKADISHEELTEEQREDLYAIVDAEDAKEGGGLLGDSTAGTHTADWIFVQLDVRLDKLSLALLDKQYASMLQINAEGGTARVTKRQSSMAVDLGLHSFTCDDSMLPGTKYAQLIATQLQSQALQAQHSAAASAPAFVALTFEDHPPHSECDKRLRVSLNAPVITLHRPLLAALLRFFSVPDAVDLQSFSAWSMAQLEALRAYSTNTVADALSRHATLDLQVQLNAPIIVVPLDPLRDTSDVLILNLGQLTIVTASVQSKQDIAQTLQSLSEKDEGAEAELSDALKGRLYDHYQMTVSNTSLALSSRGPQWRVDDRVAYLLTPLDLTVDLALCISRDVNQLPNVKVAGQLPKLSLRLSNKQLARLTAFVDAFARLEQLPHTLTCSLEGGQKRSEVLPAVHVISQEESRRAGNSVLPAASASASSGSAAMAEEEAKDKQLDMSDLTRLMNGDSQRAREVLAAIDRDGDGVVEWSEFVAWEHRRQTSRAHKQLIEARFTLQEAALSLEREHSDGNGRDETEVIVVARVSGVEVRLLKETHLTRVGVTVGRLSAQEMSAQAEGRLLLDTEVVEVEDGAISSIDSRSAPHAPQPLQRGFIVVELVHMAQESPDFEARRVENSIDVKVGDLKVLIDVASAYRLGSFMLFEILPAATSSSSSDSASESQQQQIASIVPSTPAAVLSPPSSANSSHTSSTGLGRCYQTRVALHASFQRLSVLVGVGRQLVSEMHVSGCELDVRQYLHALSTTARLQAITVRDCTPAGRRYANVLTSIVDASEAKQPRQAADDTVLVFLEYHTYSPLDLADQDNSDGAEAALRARVKGLQFVMLRRFIDENLALLLTGPVAQLIHEKKRRDRLKQTQTASTPAGAPRGGPVTQRRRSSISAALLTPAASMPSAADGAVSPLSATHFLRMDCRLNDISLVVPYHSQSDQLLQARFESITLNSARTSNLRTRLTAEFPAFTVTTTVGGSAQSAERRSVHLLTLERMTATADSNEQAHNVSAEIEVSSVQCSLCPSQYQLLLTLLTSNFGEHAQVSRHMLKQLSANIYDGNSVQQSHEEASTRQQQQRRQVAAGSSESSTAMTPLAAFSVDPSPAMSRSSPLSVTVRAIVPRVELQLLAERGSTEPAPDQSNLLRVSVVGLGCFLTLHPDGGLEVQAGMEAVTAVDNSKEGGYIGERAVLPQRRELLVIGAQHTTSASTVRQSQQQQKQQQQPPSSCPLSVTVARTVAVTGLQRTVIDVSLDNFRFSMGGVLLRLRAFLSALPPQLLEPEQPAEVEEEAVDFYSLISSPAADQPPPPPSVLSVRVRMTRPTFQLLADPTVPVSPALLFSWSAELSVDIDRSGAQERLTASGAVRDVCCYVTQLTADNAETNGLQLPQLLAKRDLEAKSEAALILQPFSANLRLHQISPLPRAMRSAHDDEEQSMDSTRQLPRRTGSLDVEGIVLRFSYSSYRLLSTTVDALIAQQPALMDVNNSNTATTPADSTNPSAVRMVASSDQDAVAVTDEFSVTDTSVADSARVSLFSEEDVSFSMRCVHVILINDCVASEVPLAKLTVDAISGGLHGLSHNRNARCTLTLSVELFDPSLVAWSPLVESYSPNIALISTIVPAAPPSGSVRTNSSQQPPLDERSVRGAVTHWLQLSSGQSLNVNVSHSMVMGVINALALFSRAEKSRLVQVKQSLPPTSSAVASTEPASLRTGQLTPVPTDDLERDFLPFRFENQTEFTIRCHALYAVKHVSEDGTGQSSSPSTAVSAPAAEGAAGGDQYGPWSIAAYSSLPFSFPPNSNPVNESLLVEVDSTLSFPALTVPFTRPSIVRHRMPGRGPPVVIVSEVYILDGVKVCRLRSRTAMTNRTDIAFEWKQPTGSSARWPSLRPHSTFFLPVLAASQIAPQLTPSAGGFAYCSPLALSGHLRQQTVARFTCARTGMPSTSTAALSFSGDLTCVLSGVSVYGSRLHGRVEDEYKHAAAASKKKGKGGDESGEEARGQLGADDGRDEHTTVYTLRPPVIIENLLSQTVEFRCLDKSREKGDVVRMQESLDRGARVPLFSPSTASPSSLSFRVPSFRQQGWTALLPLLGDRGDVDRALKGDESLVAVRSEDRELIVHCAYALVQGAVVLSLYVPYFVYNLTGVDLALSADRRQLVSLAQPAVEQRGAQPSDECPAVMFNYPAAVIKAPADEHRVSITTLSRFKAANAAQRSDAAPWSTPFSIDALGFRFSASVPAVGSAAGGSCDVGVSISQGEGAYRRTKMITLSPRLVVVNSLAHDCLLRHHQTDKVVRIAAGKQHFWQWQDSTQKPILSLNRTGGAEVEGWEWSGGFYPQRVGSTNIVVRHTADSQQLWYVRVESRVQDSTIFCVVSAYPQQLHTLSAVLPYRVQNRCLFHTVRFRQVKDGVSCGDWLYVPPMSALPYAWERPLLAGQVAIEVGLRQSIVGERWEAAIVTSFDISGQQSEDSGGGGAADQSSVVTLPAVKRLKPLPGDETRGDQQVWMQTEAHGPTRVLVVSSSQPLEQYSDEMRKAAANKGRRLARRDLNEALRARRLSELTTALDQVDVNIAQLTVNRTKTEEKLQGLENGMIARPEGVAEEDSALLVRVLGARGLGTDVDICCSIHFNGSSNRTEWRRCSGDGEVRFTAAQSAFRANNLRLSTTCRISVARRKSEREEAEYGFVEFTLFEYDDHQRQQQWLPVCSTTTHQPAGGELELSVWWIPVGPRVCRQLVHTMDAVLSEYARVQRTVKFELHELAQGRLEGVVGSANTEVQFLVRVTGMQGMQHVARRLPSAPAGGQVVVRVRSELTGKLSSAVLYSHPTDIRQALTASATVQWGQTIPVMVSEDVLDARGGETLHFSFYFIPAASTASSAPDAVDLSSPVALAETSVPLATVPISRPEQSKSSGPDERQWTNRMIPLQPLLWSATSSTSALTVASSSPRPPTDRASAAELSMTATFRRFTARSDEQRPDIKVSVNLPGMAVSVINETPEEIVLVSVHVLSIALEQAKVQQTAFVKVDHAQVDNMTSNALFPVVVSPSFVPEEERQPLLQLSATKQRGVRDQRAKTAYNLLSFPYFSVLLQSVDVRVEEELIHTVLSYVSEFTQAERFQSSQASADRQCVRHLSDVRLRGSSDRILYFQFLQIQPLSFHVSFLATPGLRARMGEQTYNPFDVLLSAASSTLGSLDNAPIKLNGQIIENAAGTSDMLLSSLAQFYQDEMLHQAYKLIGSFDFLGNPSELLSNLGTGLSDFFYEPARGLVKSPQDFGRGVAKGSLSLLRNTFGGLLGAASRITGSMSKAAAFLSMDDQFAREQQVRQTAQQPTSAVSGVVGGVQSLGMGVFRGVTGVVMDPIKGAQRAGVEGFIKGMGKGLAGVIAKPTAGLIDMTSQTLRGVGNSVNDQPQLRAAKRVRLQRVMDETGAIRPYDAQEAEREERRRKAR